MNLRSIRWRLPLSYAAIALLATVSLGLVLFVILRGYYAGQEQDYLVGNAKEISATVGKMMQSHMDSSAIQSQLDLYALLSQVQIQVFDANQKVVAASSSPGLYKVLATFKSPGISGSSASAPAGGATSAQPKSQTREVATAAPAGGVISAQPRPQTKEVAKAAPVGPVAVDPGSDPTLQALLKQQLAGQPVIYINLINPSSVHVEPGQNISSTLRLSARYTLDDSQPDFLSIIPAVGTQQGIGFGVQAVADSRRSNQVVRVSIPGPNQQPIGTVVLSNGPAYGAQILDSVARGWAIASAVAVVLAAAVGYGMSRSMSRPLVALTAVTARMANGDLAARANIAYRDEFGQLASSYNQMAEQMEQTIIALRRFVADAAHELHTPLTALRTDLELAAADEASHQELIARAQAQVERLEALTRGLLDLSRLEAAVDGQPGDDVLLDLADLARQVCEPYASRAEQGRLSFDLHLPADPAPVRGQAEQLARALGNLLDNACKFTPAGGRVALGLNRQQGWVELWVEDTGIGVPPEDLAQLGGRFHRGRNAAGYPGSGLGLAIVRAIAEVHHGRLEARNTGQGARFSLWLPLAGC